MGFVANFMRFSAVQKFRKSAKISQSYKESKGRNFFETQCSLLVIFVRCIFTAIKTMTVYLCLFDLNGFLFIKMTNLPFEPPFGGLRGNVRTLSIARSKRVADFLFAIIELFR